MCEGIPSTSHDWKTYPSLRDRLMRLYLTFNTFPEVPDALVRLKKAGLKTAILSNGSPTMLDFAVRGAKLSELLDGVLSVEEVGVYKPHPKVYRLAVERLGIPALSITFLSLNAWDAYAASAFGMRVIWCNRYGQRRERLPGAPDREIISLAEFPALVGATVRQDQLEPASFDFGVQLVHTRGVDLD